MYTIMGVLLLGYLAFLAIRGASGTSQLVNGWGVGLF
jgi:hypothetical protein